jgi:hypothetical protein
MKLVHEGDDVVAFMDTYESIIDLARDTLDHARR